ncbi:hypothetical protein [Gorillibacterium massiliense]|uniref:hypothetical protein n=1 Tax=Gorillibacterium massiliense TaxID=1280390 RepID=UPI000694AB71|nr:hypothetical protein [Gorillibacterium massiliense]
MSNNDWNDFVSEVSWLIKPNDNVIVSESVLNYQIFSPSDEFKSLFPSFTKLLMKARITRVEVNHEKFELLGWTDEDNESFGWLCKYPVNLVPSHLCKEHQILLGYFGGITERWNEQEESWLLNLNSALTSSDSEQGFQGWGTYVNEVCREEGIELLLNPNDYIAFAFEANGNLTLYHKDTLSVIMFAPDHSFEHITPLDGFPEYTLYSIDNCPNLITWIETIAKQELNRLA